MTRKLETDLLSRLLATEFGEKLPACKTFDSATDYPVGDLTDHERRMVVMLNDFGTKLQSMLPRWVRINFQRTLQKSRIFRIEEKEPADDVAFMSEFAALSVQHDALRELLYASVRADHPILLDKHVFIRDRGEIVWIDEDERSEAEISFNSLLSGMSGGGMVVMELRRHRD